MPFIRAGQKANPQPNSAGRLLTTAHSWQLQRHLGRQLRVLANIATTSPRPNVVLTSDVMKQVVRLELSVLWEDWIGDANEWKRAKYSSLLQSAGATAGEPAVNQGKSRVRTLKLRRKRGFRLLCVRGLQ